MHITLLTHIFTRKIDISLIKKIILNLIQSFIYNEIYFYSNIRRKKYKKFKN